MCTVAPVDAVLRVAAQFPVFPCRRNPEEIMVRGELKLVKAKSPLVASGFLKATQDTQQIRAWWNRWPDALAGVPTGSVTGLVVVDYDAGKVDESANAWVTEHSNELMSTRAHGTLSGGRHYLFRNPPGQEYRNGVSMTLGGVTRNGIDLRAEGGYIIWWPLHGGSVTGEIAPLPAGLVDEQRIEKRDLPPLPQGSPEQWAADRRRLLDAMPYLDPSDYGEWSRAGMAIHLASGGSDDGFQLWHSWSAGELTGDTPHGYSGVNDCRYHWSSYRHDKGRDKLVTLGSLFEIAGRRGYVRAPNPQHEALPLAAYAEEDARLAAHEAARERAAIQDEPETPAPNLQSEVSGTAPTPVQSGTEKKPARHPMRWADLKGKAPPERQWHISHWLSNGITLLSGLGGIGKTLLAQTIGTALVMKRNFVDAVTVPQEFRVLFWACEDEHDELWRRQIAICRYFDVDLDQLEGRLIIEPRLGRENSLYVPVFGAPTWTALRQELRAQVKDYGAHALILDNIGQTFGCSENDRHAVTAFLNGFASICPVTILLGHPAKAAGSEFSGSTAWENAVRMRWYLGTQLPDQKQEEGAIPDEGPDVRYLAKRKTNYTVKDYRKLIYTEGVLIPDRSDSPGQSFTDRYTFAQRQEGAEEAVLWAIAELKAIEMTGRASPTSPDYLPKKMAQMKLTKGYVDRDLRDALNRLLLKHRVKEAEVGRKVNRQPRMGLVLA